MRDGVLLTEGMGGGSEPPPYGDVRWHVMNRGY